MLDLRSTNAERKSAKCTVCGGVRVTADDSGSWEGEALFGTDDMDDTLTLVAEAEIGEAKSLYIVFEGEALRARIGFLDEGFGVRVVCARGSRYVLGEGCYVSILENGLVVPELTPENPRQS